MAETTRVWQFKIVRDCKDADLERWVNEGWTDHLLSFMPDGTLNAIFSRRITPEPVKTTVVQAVARIDPPKPGTPQPEPEKPVPVIAREAREDVMARALERGRQTYEAVVRGGMARLAMIPPPWERRGMITVGL